MKLPGLRRSERTHSGWSSSSSKATSLSQGVAGIPFSFVGPWTPNTPRRNFSDVKQSSWMGFAAHRELTKAGPHAGILNQVQCKMKAVVNSVLNTDLAALLCEQSVAEDSFARIHGCLFINTSPEQQLRCPPHPARELAKLAHLKAFRGSSFSLYCSLLNFC